MTKEEIELICRMFDKLLKNAERQFKKDQKKVARVKRLADEEIARISRLLIWHKE